MLPLLSLLLLPLLLLSLLLLSLLLLSLLLLFLVLLLLLRADRFAKFIMSCPRLVSSTFQRSDIDVVFLRTRAKKRRQMDYDHFVRALKDIATMKYAVRDERLKRVEGAEFEFRGYKGEQAAVLALLRNHVFASPQASGVAQVMRLHVTWGIEQAALQIQHRHRSGGSTADAGLIVQMRKALAARELMNLRIVKLQAAYRRYKAGQRVAELAKRVVVKYRTEEGEDYYYNRQSGAKTWEKPRVLKDHDVEPVPIAPAKEQILVQCEACHPEQPEMATVYCNDCETCYDDEHDAQAHARGNRAAHARDALHVCGHCNYQQGTWECLLCRGERRWLCDHCYHALHDEGATRHAHAAAGKTANLLELCVECEFRSCQWMCDYCGDMYCRPCFERTHAKGRFRSHSVTPQPWLTVEAGRRALLRWEKAVREEKLRVIEEAAELRRQEKAYYAASRIQTSVKTWLYRKRVLAYAAHLEKEKTKQARRDYRRKKDDKVRAKLTYRVKAKLGVAEQLESDTPEERAAKGRVPIWKKGAARLATGFKAPPSWVKPMTKVRVRLGAYMGAEGLITGTADLESTGRVKVYIDTLKATKKMAVANLSFVEHLDAHSSLADGDAAATTPTARERRGKRGRGRRGSRSEPSTPLGGSAGSAALGSAGGLMGNMGTLLSK